MTDRVNTICVTVIFVTVIIVYGALPIIMPAPQCSQLLDNLQQIEERLDKIEAKLHEVKDESEK